MPSSDKPERGFCEDPTSLLYAALGDELAGREPTTAIRESERGGQTWLCGQNTAAECLLPSQVDQYSMQLLERAGVQFLGAAVSDSVFQRVRLPDGWHFKALDDPRATLLCDAEGRARAELWFKSVFYDRRAVMTAVPVDGTEQLGEPRAE